MGLACRCCTSGLREPLGVVIDRKGWQAENLSESQFVDPVIHIHDGTDSTKDPGGRFPGSAKKTVCCMDGSI